MFDVVFLGFPVIALAVAVTFNTATAERQYWGSYKGHFFVKLDLEIALDQPTRTGDPTFGGSRTPTAHRCPQGSHAHIWSQFDQIP